MSGSWNFKAIKAAPTTASEAVLNAGMCTMMLMTLRSVRTPLATGHSTDSMYVFKGAYMSICAAVGVRRPSSWGRPLSCCSIWCTTLCVASCRGVSPPMSTLNSRGADWATRRWGVAEPPVTKDGGGSGCDLLGKLLDKDLGGADRAPAADRTALPRSKSSAPS